MGVVGFGATGLLFWAAGGCQRPTTQRLDVTDYGSGPPPVLRGRTLTLMTWNIAYARGPDPGQATNQAGSRTEIQDRLRRMGALVREQGVDVLLLQEADVDSRRSHRLDQVALLARHSGLRYAARAVSWRANYVPFPYWPPSQHYGRVVSGGAVLSRYPLDENQMILHSKPAANPWWYNLFYIYRYSQRVRLQLAPQRAVWVVNNHLEAWNKGNRVGQAHRLLREVDRLRRDKESQGSVEILVVGGDLNTVPPEARRRHGFPDDPRDDYRNDPTLTILRRMTGLREIVPRERYVAREASHFTFPTRAPTRRLDYLFVDSRARIRGYDFVRTGDFSDHLPVVARVELAGAPVPGPGARR